MGVTIIDWKNAAEINDDMPHDELKMLAAVTWGDLAYERDENKHLHEENEKLRKLIRDVYTLHWHGLDCTECPWFDECDTDGGCPWLGIMHEHMRELRVEVNV